MCGIAGFIGKGNISRERIAATLKIMNNRGPDHQAYVELEPTGGKVLLLHSRLSIIDLDARSNQPFTRGPCTIVYNGEIYNYLELKANLERKGVRFATESDTEVVLASYLDKGAECVKDFEGMWSFALFDERTGELFLSRDRFAEKPLYYFRNEEGLYFGSEIKFIKGLIPNDLQVNYGHICRFLINGYKSLYKTKEGFYQDIQEVPNAANMIVDSNGQVKLNTYWKPCYQPLITSEEAAIDEIRTSLLNTVKLRLRADVPMAFCLSGGIDSAGLASIARKIFNYDVHTYSIIDPDIRYNEADNIQATVDDLGCCHTSISLEKENNLDRLEKLIQYHDIPLSTISYYIHSFLSETISRDGYRIAVSGTGADELFTGYYDHFNLYLFEVRNENIYQERLQSWESYIKPIVRNPFLSNPHLYDLNPGFRDHIYLNNDEFSSYLLREFKEDFNEIHYSDSLLRNRMMNEMFHEGTRVILREDDLNSMFYSIENRSPYLDRQLFELAYKINNRLLIKDGYGKFLLREALKGILNDKVRLDRHKKGFNASIASVFDLNDPLLKDFVLAEGPLYELVDRTKVEALMEKPDYSNSFSKFLFNLINIKVFLEMNR